MITLRNPNRYLSQEIIEQLFAKYNTFGNKAIPIDLRSPLAKYLYSLETLTTTVDKRACGNGASHGFLLSEIPEHHTNLLIQPNKATVQDKESEYLRGEFKGKKMAFLYEGSKVNLLENYDVIVTVADSFNHNFKAIVSNRKLYRVLIDEQHTREANTGFRKSTMFNLNRNLEKIRFDCAITSITATPNTFAKVDISIINENAPKVNVSISCNFNKSIDRVVSHIKKGQKVIINTQSRGVIKLILDKAERNDFFLISGDGLRANLCRTGKYDMNHKGSNIIVCSSAAWEGWSDYRKNVHTFSFVDPKSKINSMSGSNLIQAISRPRLGSKYNEVCFYTAKGLPKEFYPELRDLLKSFVNADVKPNRKQAAEYRFTHNKEQYYASTFKEFIHYTTDKEGKMHIHILEDAVNIHLDRYKASIDYFDTYNQLFKDRNVEFKDIDEDHNQKHPSINTRKQQKIDNIIHTYPKNLEIGSQILYPYVSLNSERATKDIVNNLFIAKEALNGIYGFIEDFPSLAEDGYNFLTSPDLEKDIINIIASDPRYTKKEAKEKVEKRNLVGIIHSLVYQLVKGEISYNKVGHRTFNDTTGISIDLVKFAAEGVGLKFMEMDISTAYPRMVFRSCGLDIPTDFYGTGANRKKNKIAVNTMLNLIHKPTDEALKNELRNRRKPESKDNIRYLRNEKRKTLVKRLKKHFPNEVVKFLMDKFYTTDKGGFYDWSSFHEMNIIRLASKAFEKDNRNFQGVYTRRHDSLVFFYSEPHLNTLTARNIEYMGCSDWFGKEAVGTPDLIGKITEKIPNKQYELGLIA